jgi:hypothetical protein
VIDTKAHSQVTGFVYDNGTPRTVTGFPIRRGGVTTSTVAFVDILTADGVIVWNVLVAPSDLDGVRVERQLSGASDEMLWRIADRDFLGRGTRALAELAYRENRRSQFAAAEIADRVSRSRRDAARLLAA